MKNITSEIINADENNNVIMVDNESNEIINVDNTNDKIKVEECNNTVASADSTVLGEGIEDIRLYVSPTYIDYTGNGYTISGRIGNIAFNKNAKYYLNLLIYNKDNKLVFNSTSEYIINTFSVDFKVNLPGGCEYTTFLTATVLNQGHYSKYVSKSFKDSIYLESKAEHEENTYDDFEDDERGEKIKIYAPNIKVKVKANKYFKVTLKYKNGSPIKHVWATLKIWTGKKAKRYDLKSNSKGIIKLYTGDLKLGTHKVKITYEDWISFPGYYGVKNSKIIVKKTLKSPKKTTTNKKSSSKYKIITTTAKFHWITKKSGKFKVKTIIFDMTAGFRAPYKYVDTWLYKNGKIVDQSKYKVKMKINGKWTKWKTAGWGTNHHRYAVKDSASVGGIKVKFHK